MQVGAIARLVLRVLSRPMYCPNNIARQLLSALSVSFAINKIPFECIPGKERFLRRSLLVKRPLAKNTGETCTFKLQQTSDVCIVALNEKRDDSRYALPGLITRRVREKRRVKGEERRDWTKTNLTLTWQVLKNRVMK